MASAVGRWEEEPATYRTASPMARPASSVMRIDSTVACAAVSWTTAYTPMMIQTAFRQPWPPGQPDRGEVGDQPGQVGVERVELHPVGAGHDDRVVEPGGVAVPVSTTLATWDTATASTPVTVASMRRRAWRRTNWLTASATGSTNSANSTSERAAVLTA